MEGTIITWINGLKISGLVQGLVRVVNGRTREQETVVSQGGNVNCERLFGEDVGVI